MTDGVTTKIEGADELLKLLGKLPVRLRSKYLKRAVRRGVTLARDEIKRTAPIRVSDKVITYRKGQKRPKPGRLRRLIRIRPRRGKRSYVKVSLFYPTQGLGNDPKNAFYWRFIEYGTQHVRAHHYIRDAAQRKFPQIVRTIIKETNEGIRAELAKAKS